MIKTPVNQKVLTNVAIVRLKKGGKKFELACYKNKVQDFRNKQETDINEVLQINKIFSNVISGDEAKKNDLKKAFGNKVSPEQIIVEILNGGDMQVSEKEREGNQESLKNDIANLIVGMTLDGQTGN
jgi:ribosome maturation protein SDO1